LKTYLIFIFCIVFAACGAKKNAPDKKSEGDASVQPDEMRPKIDTKFEEYFFQAQLLKSKGDSKKAYDAFNECLSLRPNEPTVNYELARIERAVFMNAESANAKIKKSLAADPKNPWYHRLQAEIFMDLGKYELAAKSFKTCYELNPDDPNTLYDQASALIGANKITEAIAVYDQLELKMGAYEELSFQKHDLYLQINQPQKAARELEKLAEAFPSEARYWGVVAQFYYQNNEREKAKAALDKMVLADPDNGMVHYQLSEYYAATGDEKRSYEELKQAFQTFDLSIDQKIMIMVKYYQLTENSPTYLTQAYELLDILIAVNKSEAKSFSMQGDFLFRDRRDNEALEAFQKALALDKSKSQNWEQVLALQLSLNKFDQLAQDGQTAIELFPTNPLFYWYTGNGMERSGKLPEAIETWNMGKEMVVENNDLLSQFYSSLGGAYNKTKDFQKSDEAFDKAILLNPNDVFTLNNYAYYLSLRKTKLDRAEQLIKRALEESNGNANFFDTYAWVLFQKANYPEALVWIEKAINSTASPSAEVREHYGDILFKNDKIDAAVEQWKMAQQGGKASTDLNNKISNRSLE
jgi:tetratricopeptide (TPR) repeat protein